MLGTRFRRRQRWRPPVWFRIGAPVVFVGAFLLYKVAGIGTVPMVAALIAWIVIGVLLWTSRPTEPGEFR
jgi:hypothetical protein